MNLDPSKITVGDLFFDLRGVETRVFSHEDDSAQLFLESAFPWDVLNMLPIFFVDMLTHDPRKVTHKSAKNLSVERNPDCCFACLEDVYKYIGPQAQIDHRSLRLRGGKNLHCDGSGKIWGSTYIGPWVQIRHNGGLLGSVVIGDGVSYAEAGPKFVGIGGIIGHGVTVRRSVIRAGVKIEAHTEVVDCVIGRGVYIDAGAQFAHENFSGKNVDLRFFNGDEIPNGGIQTGRKKLGAIIGDECYIGANVTMHPGVILMPGCRVHGGQTLQSGIYTKEYFMRQMPR